LTHDLILRNFVLDRFTGRVQDRILWLLIRRDVDNVLGDLSPEVFLLLNLTYDLNKYIDALVEGFGFELDNRTHRSRLQLIPDSVDMLEEVHGHVLLDRACLILVGCWLFHGGKLCLKYDLLEHLVLLSVIIPAYHLLYGADSFRDILVILLFWNHQEL